MEIAPEIKPKIEALLSKKEGTLADVLGIEYLKFYPDCVSAKMPVDHRTKQPFGLLHGGASVALAESLASLGAWINIDDSKFIAVGMEINANHIRGVTEGWVLGTATPIHKGSRSHVWEIRIVDTANRPVCVSRCTLAIVPKR